MSGRGQERKGVATLARHRDAYQRMTTRGCMPGGSWPPNTPGLPRWLFRAPYLSLGVQHSELVAPLLLSRVRDLAERNLGHKDGGGDITSIQQTNLWLTCPCRRLKGGGRR